MDLRTGITVDTAKGDGWTTLEGVPGNGPVVSVTMCNTQTYLAVDNTN